MATVVVFIPIVKVNNLVQDYARTRSPSDIVASRPNFDIPRLEFAARLCNSGGACWLWLNQLAGGAGPGGGRLVRTCLWGLPGFGRGGSISGMFRIWRNAGGTVR